ncbi:hypothetical protein L6452_26771 [Arctium lappa]|uniref:Uncharacterized protein n=1 Tax=Arctium lappa TaxID=4217 RepID=A0ACB8ZV98_ARCLA|nr:hypothetical protein L6452_26771 [Arctium lappa]
MLLYVHNCLFSEDNVACISILLKDVLQDRIADIEELQIHCLSYWANCGGVYVGIRGLAFQLIDDVLDFTGTSSSLGIGALSDIHHVINSFL